MALEERLGALAREGAGEDRIGIGHGHDEDRDLGRLAVEGDLGVAEVGLGLPGRVGQGDEDLGGAGPPGADGVLDGGQSALIAMLGPEPIDLPAVDGQPCQHILEPNALHLDLPVTEVSEEDLAREIAAVTGQPFDLATEPSDQLPGVDLYENGAAATAAQTPALATDLAYYATHGARPAGVTTLPAQGAPARICAGSPG